MYCIVVYSTFTNEMFTIFTAPNKEGFCHGLCTKRNFADGSLVVDYEHPVTVNYGDSDAISKIDVPPDAFSRRSPTFLGTEVNLLKLPRQYQSIACDTSFLAG